MTRFEVVLPRDRLALVQSALEKLGIIQIETRPVEGALSPHASLPQSKRGNSSTTDDSLPADERMTLVFVTDDRISEAAFQAVCQNAGSVEIFSFPLKAEHGSA
jgi:hypothetical protein